MFGRKQLSKEQEDLINAFRVSLQSTEAALKAQKVAFETLVSSL